MNLVELTSFLVKSIVKDLESVSIKEIKDDDITIIEVLVSNDDIKYVIGRNGVTANSIRTIVQASSYVNNLGKVKINIDSL